MTRQNITDGPREVMTKPCPTCSGDGIVYSESSAAIDLERRLGTLAAGSRSKAFRVEANSRVASLLVGPGAGRLSEIEERCKRRFYLELTDGDAVDHLVVLAEGTIEAMRPSTPVEEGDELELALVEVGLYDSQAGVGKIGDYEVNVPAAATQVGKKLKVRIVRALKDCAYAVPAGPAQELDEPLTAESVAERPTRAPARKASSKPQTEAASRPAPVEKPAESEPKPAAVTPVASSSIVEGGAEEAPVRPKKRTRRGSRGGRRRHKPAQAGATSSNGAGNGAAAPAGSGNEGETGPSERRPARPPAQRQRVQQNPKPPAVAAQQGPETAPAKPPVKASEAAIAPAASGTPQSAPEGEETPRPKKRTRRGSRGGRRRHKPAQSGGPNTGAESTQQARPPGAESGNGERSS